MQRRRFSAEDFTAVKADKRDMKILALLSQDSRRPIKDIARRVRISADTARYRIKRLERLGVISGYIPIINFKKLNHYVYHMFLLVDEQYHDEKNKLIAELEHHEAVLSVKEYSDRWDFEITLLARNLGHFDSIMTDITSRYPQLIVERDFLGTIKNYTMLHFPTVAAQRSTSSQTNAKMDGLDLKLLMKLAHDSSLSTYELGRKLNISADTVSYRIKKLVASGAILKFSILVNLSLLGFYWYTFVIRIRTLDKQHEAKFSEFVRKYPSILRACKTIGEWDILIYIAAPSQKRFHTIVKDIKNEFSTVIKNYQTWIGYKEHIYNAFPSAVLTQFSRFAATSVDIPLDNTVHGVID